MEDYREIGPPGNGETRKTGASNLAAVRETTRHVRIHASRVIFRGAHNAFVCSAEPTGWHLTTGQVFCMADEHWMCLSPACDMVPSQLRPWQVEAYGERLPFIGIKLQPVKATKIPKDVHSNRYLFVRLGDAVAGYCFNPHFPSIVDIQCGEKAILL